MSEDRIKRNKRQQLWRDVNRERINMLFRLGTKDRIDQAATAASLSKSQWVQNAIDEQIKREHDGGEIPQGIINNLINWLKDHNHDDDEIVDCIKSISEPNKDD